MADTKVGGVYIEIQAKMGSLEADLKKIEARLQQTDSTGQGLSSTFSGMGKYLAAGVIAGGLYEVGKACLSAAANMESNRIALTTMLGSTEKANQLLKDMTEFAAKTPFDLPGVVDAGKRMLAFGFAADEIIPKLRQLGDVSAGLSQPIGDIVYLFGQIKTQGKAMTQDLNQFANRGIPIFDEVAKAMGVPKEQVRKLAEEGKITYSVIEKAFDNMTAAGSKFGGLMEAQSQSLGGKWSNFQDTLGKTATIIGNDISPVAKDLLDIATNLLSKISSKDVPESITMTGSIIKDVNALLNGTKEHIDHIVEAMGDKEADALYEEVLRIEKTADGASGHFEEILGYFDKATGQYQSLNGAAALYTAYTSGAVKLTQAQIEKLEKILALGQEMSTQDHVVSSVGLALGQEYAAVLEKVYEAQKKSTKEEKASAPDAKWKQAKKAAEDLINTINKGYISALGTADEKLNAQQEELQKQYDKTAAAYNKGLITYQQYEQAKDQIDQQYRALELSRFEKNLEDMASKYSQFTSGLTQISGQLSSLISLNASNQTTAIDNRLQKQLDAIDAAYEAEVEAIENSELSEEQKNAKLEALDAQKERDEEAAEKKAAKQKRKINREAAKQQKALSIFETVIATPQAAFQAYKSAQVLPYPASQIVGLAMAAATTALGVAKLKLIKDTPLPEAAEGMIVPAVPGGTPVRVAEAGSSEALIPLNDQGIGVLKAALQGTNESGTSVLNVYLDGAVIGKWLYNSTKNRTVQFHANGMVA